MNFRTVIMMFLAAGALASPVYDESKTEYIDNGTIRLGVNLGVGGAITYIADAQDQKNIVNNYDWGRQIQMSFFGFPIPYTEDGQVPAAHWEHIGWNPIQAGDDYGNGSTIVEFSKSATNLYVKCIPMQWPLNDVPGECTYECWIELKGNTAQVRARMNNARSDTTLYPGRHQELPAVYSNGEFYKLMTYRGDRPFTGDSVVRIPKKTGGGFPWDYWLATENWAALVDDNDWGLGIYKPDSTFFIGGFAGPQGAGGTFDSPTGYIAPLHTEILDHDIVYEYSYTLIVGDLTEIRDYAVSQGRATGLPDWTFEQDRQHWRYHNGADAGWPINEFIELDLGQNGVTAISPPQLWQAEAAPRLHITAAFETSQTQAAVAWTKHETDGYDPNFTAGNNVLFDIVGDGEFRTYTIDLASVESYAGPMSYLAFQPSLAAEAGGSVKVKRIWFDGGASNAELTHRYLFNNDLTDEIGTEDGISETDIHYVSDAPAGAVGAMMSLSVGGNDDTAPSGFKTPNAAMSTPSGSVSVWLKADTQANTDYMLGGNGFKLKAEVGSIKAVYTGLKNDAVSAFVGFGETPMPTNDWTHVVFTWNNDTSNRTFFVNGAWAGTVTDALADVVADKINVGNLKLNSAANQFDGSFYDLQFYAGELNSDEVLDLYANPGSAIIPPLPELTHRYAFDFDAVDAIGSLDGTLSSTNGNLEVPEFTTDLPAGADTSFASRSIELGMNEGTKSSWVNFGSGIQTDMYDGKAGSYSCWFKADQLKNGRDLLSNIGGAALRTMLRDNGQLRLAGAGMGNVDFTFSSPVTSNTWHHLVVSWDDTAGNGSIALDGNMQSYTFATNALTDPTRLMLGNFASDDSKLNTQFDGHIYDLQIYDGVLAPLYVNELYANPGAALIAPPEPIPVKTVTGAVLLTSDGAWDSTGVVGTSNGGRQTNSNSGGAFGSWGGASFNSSSESQVVDMQATASSVQQVYTEGYTYSLQASAAAALETMQDNQVAYLLANGTPVGSTRRAGLNYTGTFGSDYRNTIYGYYTVEAGDPLIGQTIGLRLCSAGSQSRFRADGDSAVTVRLTSHAGANGDGVLFETDFELDGPSLVFTDRVLHLGVDGTGTLGSDAGESCYILQAAWEWCSVSTEGDTFRDGTTYELAFDARCSGWDGESQLEVSIGSFSTNLTVGTSVSECVLTLNADAAGIRGEALQVRLSPTGDGVSEYRIQNLRLSAVSQSIGRWFEDNNMGTSGGYPPDFATRLEPANIASWETTLETLDVYYIRSSLYKNYLSTNTAVMARMAEVFNQYGIKVAVDDTAATWGHAKNNFETPDYQDSIDMLQDLDQVGFDLCAVGLQSVLSKPWRDGDYAMSWRYLDIMEYIKQVKPHFPDLEYGVIDAMPAKGWSYKTEYSDLKNVVENAGLTLDFIEQDFPIDFAITGSRSYADMVEAERFTRGALGLASGLYLTSSRGGQTSDELWRSDVLTGLEAYLAAGAAPERITLAAWYPHPIYSTPDETDPALNPNGSTMLGTFLLSDEIISTHGFTNQTDIIEVSVIAAVKTEVEMDFSGSASGDLMLRWDSLPGQSYSVYKTTDLTLGWIPVSEGITYPLDSYEDSGVLTNGDVAVFYKLELD